MRFCIKPALSYYRRKIILNLHKRYTSLNSHIAYANCSAAAILRRKKANVKVALEGAVVFLSAHAPNLMRILKIAWKISSKLCQGKDLRIPDPIPAANESPKDEILQRTQEVVRAGVSVNIRLDYASTKYWSMYQIKKVRLEKSSAHPSKNYEQQDLDKSIKPAKKDVERSERVLNLKDRWKPNCQEYKEVASWQTEKKCLKPR